MKKAIAISMILLTVLSTLAIFTSQVGARNEQLTTNPYPDYDPSWSPDGTKIAYVGHADAWYRHIWVMNNDGSGKTQLTSGSVVDSSPAYSPDGTKIAFQRWGFRGDRFDIVIMNADGSGVTRKTFNGLPGKTEGTYEQPMWSEDGTKLIFHYGEGTTGSPKTAYWICVMPVSGTDTDIVTRGRGGQPMFCKGDTKILFNTDPTAGLKRIALMNADGTGRQNLTEGPNDTMPHMSSTTNRILFNRNGDLYSITEDGTNLFRVTSDGTNGYAVWSPDDNYIAYNSGKSGNDDIWKMEAPPPELASLPAYGLSHPPTGGYDGNLVLHRIDVDPHTVGDQQVVTVAPSETISIAYEMQIWTGGGSTWNPPSSGYYFVVHTGGTDYYPGITITDSEKPFSLTAPSEEGEYYIWLCGDAQYNVPDALNNIGDPTLPPGPYPAHAKIVVGAHNLLKNPGFEEQLDYWSVTVGTAFYTTDGCNPHSGSYAAKGVEPNTGSLGILFQDITSVTGVGGQYIISGWIKTEGVTGGGGAVMGVSYVTDLGYTPADGHIGGATTGPPTGTTDWTFFQSAVFTLPPMPSDCVALHYSLDFSDAAGTAWWDDLSLIEVTPPPAPQPLDPWEYCPYVYLDYGFGFPWDTNPDLPVNVLYTGTYFWGDLRVIQYWFHWNVDYMWWLPGFVKSSFYYTMGEDWVSPLRQPEKQHDWEPIIVIVDDEGSISCVLWRWHYNWFKYEPGVLSPTYQETHIKLWWSIASHTPLNEYLAVDLPVLLEIASWLKTPNQFKTALGQYGDLTTPPLYELYEFGVSYPCGMQEWDEDLALSLGFSASDLKYITNPTFVYSELVNLGRLLRFITHSPVDILVTAPDGLRVGYDSVTETIVNEIEGATYSGPGTEPQVVNIPSPLPGVYNVDIVGTDYGVYAITIWSMAEDGSVAGIETYAGETVEGAFYVYSAIITDEIMTISPDPAAELEHLKEFIDEIPDDCLDQTTRRADHLKKALLTKIDEVILKVEAGNYTDAVNKLSYDIRAKVDGDCTAVDWIVDPEKQHSLCTIIEHIISSIEVLQQA